MVKLEKSVNELSDTMKKKVDEHSLAIQGLESNLAAQGTELSSQMNRINKTLTDRIETTNDELNIFRNQILARFKNLEQALDKLGTSVYEIVKLQRKQFYPF